MNILKYIYYIHIDFNLKYFNIFEIFIIIYIFFYIYILFWIIYFIILI